MPPPVSPTWTPFPDTRGGDKILGPVPIGLFGGTPGLVSG